MLFINEPSADANWQRSEKQTITRMRAVMFVLSRMKTRIGIIFDDGFAKSTLTTAKLFEQYKLPAYFAVLAEPKDFSPNIVKGDFGLWNELQSRGHVVYPHGFTHTKLSEIPHQQAVDELKRCLDTFSE